MIRIDKDYHLLKQNGGFVEQETSIETRSACRWTESLQSKELLENGFGKMKDPLSF